MKSNDKNLGMGRSISRRDLLHGLGVLGAASLVPGSALADAVLAAETQITSPELVYPPSLTGLRGSHVGSFEVAHQLAREGVKSWGEVSDTKDDVYDLVVVGAGISGLAAAHYFRKEQPNAKILILDNHDDFGGHAKRNEFTVGGRTVLGYGGSQTMEEPSDYSDVVHSFLRDLDIDLDQFYEYYDNEFFRRNDLAAATFFGRDMWGKDKLVRYDIGGLNDLMPMASPKQSAKQAVAQMPISEAARRQLVWLLTAKRDRLENIPYEQVEDYLYTITYKDFLEKHANITEPDVFKVLQDLSTDTGVGIEAASAGTSILYIGLPGLGIAGLADNDEEYEPYVHHFPDGNASIARLLVRNMIPDVAAGSSAEDIVEAQFDYSKLDRAGNAVRLRLNSTVVKVEHVGKAKSAKFVDVDYVQNGSTLRVRAKHCVMACYNAMIPALCPEIGKKQSQALKHQVKSPILYTSVALRNWQAWKKLGIGSVSCPGSYHVNAMMDFPVNVADYQYTSDPDQPVVIHMERFPHRANQGMSKQEQFRQGRYELLSTPFETIERNIRSQLADMLGGGGFDPEKDIEAITVNRWAHGYSYNYDWVNEPYYDDENDKRYPHIRGRKPWGRIAIANSDAGAQATMDTAIEQAYRAVGELL